VPGQALLKAPAPDLTPTREISFAGNDPAGYFGRHCSNAESNALVAEAIDHLRAGGTLAGLSMEAAIAYSTMVAEVEANVRAECLAAAPDQCTDEMVPCDGIVATMHAQLITEPTCSLELSGVEHITLREGEACHLNPLIDATGSDTADSCMEPTTGGGGLDDSTG